MPYDEEEIASLSHGAQRMMAKMALAGHVFDKWMSGGVVVYCVDSLKAEETSLGDLVIKAWIEFMLRDMRPNE